MYYELQCTVIWLRLHWLSHIATSWAWSWTQMNDLKSNVLWITMYSYMTEAPLALSHCNIVSLKLETNEWLEKQCTTNYNVKLYDWGSTGSLTLQHRELEAGDKWMTWKAMYYELQCKVIWLRLHWLSHIATSWAWSWRQMNDLKSNVLRITMYSYMTEAPLALSHCNIVSLKLETNEWFVRLFETTLALSHCSTMRLKLETNEWLVRLFETLLALSHCSIVSLKLETNERFVRLFETPLALTMQHHVPEVETNYLLGYLRLHWLCHCRIKRIKLETNEWLVRLSETPLALSHYSLMGLKLQR